MGIANSGGIIRDFAGPYFVSEDNMAFGWPTKYLQLDYTKAKGRVQGWDSAVHEASEIYKGRMVCSLFLNVSRINLINILLFISIIYYVTIVIRMWQEH